MKNVERENICYITRMGNTIVDTCCYVGTAGNVEVDIVSCSKKQGMLNKMEDRNALDNMTNEEIASLLLILVQSQTVNLNTGVCNTIIKRLLMNPEISVGKTEKERDSGTS